MKNWYAKTTNKGSAHEQGLVADEKTGRNIAATYDPKDAPLVAAAPDLLAALQGLIHSVEHEVEPHGRMVCGIRNARAAIAKAKL